MAFVSLIVSYVLEKRRRRHEEQISGHGAAEIEYPVIVAGWPADEHVLEHLLDGARRTAVADEIGAKFTMRGAAEGHVVAQDLDFFTILDDGGERAVSGRRLDGIIQFDVRKLSAADDAFLRFGGERIPCAKIVEILLNDDVAAAGKFGVLVADEHGVGCGRAPGILRPVDKTHEIAVVKVTEALHFVHRRNRISDPRHKLGGQLET